MSEGCDCDFWDRFFEEQWLESVTLHIVADTLRDGQPVVREKRELRALVQEHCAVSPGRAGSTRAGLTFIIPAAGANPRPGDKMEYGGRVYDLKSIQLCKTVRGRPVACRCQSF